MSMGGHCSRLRRRGGERRSQRRVQERSISMFFAIDTPNVGDYSNPRLLAELVKEAEEVEWDGFFLLALPGR